MSRGLVPAVDSGEWKARVVYTYLESLGTTPSSGASWRQDRIGIKFDNGSELAADVVVFATR